MYKAIVLLFCVSSLNARPSENSNKETISNPNYQPNVFEQAQNKAAKYQFSSNVEDNINDLTQKRAEIRDGLNVIGSYSYSDGYIQRTVFYEADDKGYRITKTEVTELDGPHVDLTGTASIDNNAHGRRLSYRVQSVPVPGPFPKVATGEILN